MASPRPRPLDRNTLPEWLTTGQFARLTGVDRKTIWQQCQDGRLPTMPTPGGHHRISVDVLRQRWAELRSRYAPAANDNCDADNDCACVEHDD